MADEKSDRPAFPDRRERPAQTIELKATEISSKAPAAPAEPEVRATAAEQDAAQTAQAREPGKEQDKMPNDARRAPWLPPGTAVPLVAAALAACFVVAVLLLILSVASPFRGRDDGLSVISARQSLTEQQLRDLASRPPPPTVDPKAMEEFTARLARIESAVSTRLTSIEGAVKSAADSSVAVGRRVDELTAALRSQTETANRRIEELAKTVRDARSQADAAAAAATAARNTPDTSRADLDKLASRLATVELSAKAVEAEIAKRTGGSDDRAGRLAIAATSLRNLVERGEAFAAELAAVQSLAADRKSLAPLEPFARTGVPSSFALARELTGLVPALTRAAVATGPEGGFLVKLQANAERLVRIRPVGDAAGDDPASIIARVEDKSAQNDIAGALGELVKLPPNIRTPAEDWIKKAQSRAAAIEATRQFAAAALAALGRS
jgi:hypothetical protein